MLEIVKTFVVIRNGEVLVNAKGVGEAKLALKELKLVKKELGLVKRAINEEARIMRAKHTDSVRRQLPMVGGHGFVGGLFRSVQRVSRANERADLAIHLAPLENRKQEIERLLIFVAQAEIQVEHYLAGASAASP